MPSGRDAERAAVKIYQASGFETYLPPKAKYREQDVWGLFDILAFDGHRFEFMQVKSGRDASGINDWFKRATTYEAAIDDLQVSFLHQNGDGWRLARSTADGYEWVYDGRYDDGTLEAFLLDLDDVSS